MRIATRYRTRPHAHRDRQPRIHGESNFAVAPFHRPVVCRLLPALFSSCKGLLQAGIRSPQDRRPGKRNHGAGCGGDWLRHGGHRSGCLRQNNKAREPARGGRARSQPHGLLAAGVCAFYCFVDYTHTLYTKRLPRSVAREFDRLDGDQTTTAVFVCYERLTVIGSPMIAPYFSAAVFCSGGTFELAGIDL